MTYEYVNFNATDNIEELLGNHTPEELEGMYEQLLEYIDKMSNMTDEEVLHNYGSWERYTEEYFNKLELFEWLTENELYNINLGGNNEETT